MKINSEYQQQINQNLEKTSRNKSSEDFSQMLEQEISQSSGTSQGKEKSAPQSTQMMQSTQALGGSLLTMQQQEPSFMHQMDNLLNQWENYAADMDSPESSLKQIYSHLEHIMQGARDLKNSSGFDSQPQEVKSLVEELEILATTEVFKFNRGDYLE